MICEKSFNKALYGKYIINISLYQYIKHNKR